MVIRTVPGTLAFSVSYFYADIAGGLRKKLVLDTCGQRVLLFVLPLFPVFSGQNVLGRSLCTMDVDGNFRRSMSMVWHWSLGPVPSVT